MANIPLIQKALYPHIPKSNGNKVSLKYLSHVEFPQCNIFKKMRSHIRTNLDRTNYICSVKKVRKRARIRNQNNQAPHLTQDTNGKGTTSQLDITNESQEVIPFPAGDHKAPINRRARKHNKKGQK